MLETRDDAEADAGPSRPGSAAEAGNGTATSPDQWPGWTSGLKGTAVHAAGETTVTAAWGVDDDVHAVQLDSANVAHRDEGTTAEGAPAGTQQSYSGSSITSPETHPGSVAGASPDVHTGTTAWTEATYALGSEAAALRDAAMGVAATGEASDRDGATATDPTGGVAAAWEFTGSADASSHRGAAEQLALASPEAPQEAALHDEFMPVGSDTATADANMALIDAADESADVAEVGTGEQAVAEEAHDERWRYDETVGWFWEENGENQGNTGNDGKHSAINDERELYGKPPTDDHDAPESHAEASSGAAAEIGASGGDYGESAGADDDAQGQWFWEEATQEWKWWWNEDAGVAFAADDGDGSNAVAGATYDGVAGRGRSGSAVVLSDVAVEDGGVDGNVSTGMAGQRSSSDSAMSAPYEVRVDVGVSSPRLEFRGSDSQTDEARVPFGLDDEQTAQEVSGAREHRVVAAILVAAAGTRDESRKPSEGDARDEENDGAEETKSLESSDDDTDTLAVTVEGEVRLDPSPRLLETVSPRSFKETGSAGEESSAAPRGSPQKPGDKDESDAGSDISAEIAALEAAAEARRKHQEQVERFAKRRQSETLVRFAEPVVLHPDRPAMSERVRSHVRRVAVNVRNTLDCSNLSLGDAHVKLIADTMFHCNTALTKLSLAGNCITSQTTVSAISRMLANPRTQVRTMSLENNEIDDEGAANIAQALETNVTLTELRIGGNLLTNVGVAAFSEMVVNFNRTLTQLSFGGATMPCQVLLGAGAEDGQDVVVQGGLLSLRNFDMSKLDLIFVAESLRRDIKSLTALDISGNDLTYEECDYLMLCLRDNRTLTALDLSDNRGIGAAGAMLLYRNMTTCPTMRVIKLDEYELPMQDLLGLTDCSDVKFRGYDPGPKLHNLDMVVISEALRRNTKLTALDLRHHWTGDTVFSACDWLLGNDVCKITDWSMTDCHIHAAACDPFSRGLAKNTLLRRLDLQDNPKLGSPGARLIATALEGHPALTELNLSGCGIGQDGADALGHMLKTNTSIVRLYAARNPDMEGGGARVLVKHLTHNTTLEELFLSYCGVDAVGATGVGEMLDRNDTIVSLDLSDNPLSDEGAVELADGLLGNARLRVLDVRDCSLGLKGMQALQVMLCENHVLLELLRGGNTEDYDNEESIKERLNKNHNFDSIFDEHRRWKSGIRRYPSGNRLIIREGHLRGFIATGDYRMSGHFPLWEYCLNTLLVLVVTAQVAGLVYAFGEVCFADLFNNDAVLSWSVFGMMIQIGLALVWATKSRWLPLPAWVIYARMICLRRVKDVTIDLRYDDPTFRGMSPGTLQMHHVALASALRLGAFQAFVGAHLMILWKCTWAFCATTATSIVAYALSMSMADYKALLASAWSTENRRKVHRHPSCHGFLFILAFIFRFVQLGYRVFLLAMLLDTMSWPWFFTLMYQIRMCWFYWGMKDGRWTTPPPKSFYEMEDPVSNHPIEPGMSEERKEKIREIIKKEEAELLQKRLKRAFNVFRQVGHAVLSVCVWVGDYDGLRVCDELDQSRARNRQPFFYFFYRRLPEECAILGVLWLNWHYRPLWVQGVSIAMVASWLLIFLQRLIYTSIAEHRVEQLKSTRWPSGEDVTMRRVGLTWGPDRKKLRRQRKAKLKRARTLALLAAWKRRTAAAEDSGSDDSDSSGSDDSDSSMSDSATPGGGAGGLATRQASGPQGGSV